MRSQIIYLKTILGLIGCAYFALLTMGCSDAKKGEDGVITSYGLAITAAADLAINIEVNGVPYMPKEAGDLQALSIPIHGEVIPGKNVLEVIIGTAEVSPNEPLESVLVPLPAKRSLDITLQLDNVTEPEPGKYVTQVEDLKQITWEPEVENNEVKLPYKLSLEFTAPRDHPLPIWMKSKNRSVPNLKDTLTMMHRDIIRVLRSGNAEKIGRMSEIAYQEAAIAYPLGGDTKRRQETDIAEIKHIISTSGAEIPDFLEPLSCKSYAQGRLFECFAKDGEAPVRILLPGEDPIYFTFLFSVIDEELRIVR